MLYFTRSSLIFLHFYRVLTHNQNSVTSFTDVNYVIYVSGVLLLDPDVYVSCTDIAFAQGVWRSGDAMVGFFPRLHRWAVTGEQGKENSREDRREEMRIDTISSVPYLSFLFYGHDQPTRVLIFLHCIFNDTQSFGSDCVSFPFYVVLMSSLFCCFSTVNYYYTLLRYQ